VGVYGEARRALLWLPHPALVLRGRRVGVTHLEQLSHPQSRPTLSTAGSLQGVPSSCCGRRVAVWKWRVFEPTIRVWRSGTTCKQPVNLGVEGAEEFLTILPDYKPTVRPPPKRC
jgi:hypothetical protein